MKMIQEDERYLKSLQFNSKQFEEKIEKIGILSQ